MNPYQKRMKDALDKMEAIRKKAETEKRAMTAEELTQREVLAAEYKAADAEWKSIQTEEELRAQAYGEGGGALTVEGDPVVAIPDAPIYRGSAASALGQQLLDVRTMGRPDNFAKSEVSGARARLEQTEKRNQVQLEAQAKKEGRAAGTGGFTVGIPSEGGFFLQGETSVDLMTAGFNNSEVLSRCASRTLSAGTQFVEIIGIDESSRADGSRGGGVRVYTTAELAAMTQSKTVFNKLRIEPKKLTGLYYASGEMIKNVTFLGQEMRQLFGEEFAFKCQNLVIRGTGAGEALGILEAPCLISQAKETGQKADTIQTENILNMEKNLWNEGPSCVYLVNRETKPQLSVLSIAVGTGGVLAPLYKNDFYNGKRMSTLNGFPCITIEQASALGDKGDIILADLSQYITANKGDINEAMSIHVMFLYDQETYRFIYYFDGQPRWAQSVTPYKGASGAKVGPFVTLAAR
jgi:HK97 family phage major capsid protein